MTRLVRMLLWFGLLVLGVAVIVLWRDDRAAHPEKPAAAPGEPRIGRSTLGHGGPGVGGPSEAPGSSLPPPQNSPSGQSPQATRGTE